MKEKERIFKQQERKGKQMGRRKQEISTNIKMDNLTAVLIAEGVTEDVTKEQYLQAWQQLVDTGMAWSLQGRFGRIAMQLIEHGAIKKFDK